MLFKRFVEQLHKCQLNQILILKMKFSNHNNKKKDITQNKNIIKIEDKW